MNQLKESPISTIFNIFRNQPAAGSPAHIFLSSQEENIRQSLCLLLSTPEGSRPLYPHWGSRLRQFMFRRADGALFDRIRDHVKSVVAQFEPRVQVEDILVQENKKIFNEIEIYISYKIIESGLRQSLLFPMTVLE